MKARQKSPLFDHISVFPAMACAAVMLMLAPAARATLIYSDPLNGGDVTLDATSPEDRSGVGAADWVANSAFRANGNVTDAEAESSAWLPFTPESGFLYTLSAKVNVTAGDTSWITLGFAEFNDSDETYWENGINGYGTLMKRDNGTVRINPGVKATDYSEFDPDDTPEILPDEEQTFKIELDTRFANSTDWEFSFFLDDFALGGPSTVNGTGADAADINYVGFSRWQNAGGTVSDFSLTVIPEPSTLILGLIGLMMGGVTLFRRR